MIRSFGNKQLAALFAGRRTRISQQFHKRVLVRLDVLDSALEAEDLNLPGYNFHGLQGAPKRYSVHVNGAWCITFEFDGGDALNVAFEQYTKEEIIYARHRRQKPRQMPEPSWRGHC